MILKIILFLVIALNILLSFFVMSQNPKSTNNRLFSSLSFLAALWGITNYMTGIYSTPFWVESTYAFGALLIGLGFIWVLEMTNNKISARKNIVISLVSIVFFVASYLPGFISIHYDQIYLGGVFTGYPGWGLLVYTIFFLLEGFMILFTLHKTIKISVSENRKKQLQCVFWGVFICLILTTLGSFILPLFSIFVLGGIDSIGFLLFLLLISYSITRHQLFSIKVIAVQLITFMLWIFIFVRILFAEDTEEMWIECGLLLIAVIVGITLIRSAFYEMKQNEQIAKLTDDLHRAYAHIKNLNEMNEGSELI